MNDNELADALLAQDSSAYMDGSHNWVLAAHPEERRGKITAHVPWQAWYLLGEAAARIRELSAERRAWKIRSDTFMAQAAELSAENERLRAAGNELAHQAATGGIVGGRLDAALVAWRAALGEDR